MSAQGTVDEPVTGRAAARAAIRPLRFLIQLVKATFVVCMRYRVTGLAAEAGFFALLSLPPLVLGLVASAGYLGEWLGGGVVDDLRTRIAAFAGTFLTPDAVDMTILPMFNDVAERGRLEIVSIGFVLSLWSGSRALNVYVDTVSIMYGQGGRRGIVRTRALSFSLYVSALVIGTVLIPLLMVGPSLLSDWLEQAFDGGVPALAWTRWLYWLVVSLIGVSGLTSLYHVANPQKTPWRRNVPGAVLALVIWLGSSVVLRFWLAESVGGPSIYGPLATPIILLIWLYALAIAVLIGAALNAALNSMLEERGR